MIPSPLRCRSTATALWLLTVTTAPGAELVVREAQSLVLAQPAGFAYRLDSPTYAGDGKDGFATALAIEAGGRLSLTRPGDTVGVVLGLDAALQQASGGPGSLRSVLTLASAGAGWAISDKWVLLGEGRAGLGVSSIALDATTYAPAFSATGQARAFDLRLMAGYAITDRWRLLAILGYGRVESGYSHQGVDLTVRQAGISAGIGVAYSFSRDPVSLK